MEDLIKFLIEPLVTDISKVKIEKTEEDQNIKFLIHIPKDDIAKVIGKEGKMVKSIKNLLKIRAIKEDRFVTIEVTES